MLPAVRERLESMYAGEPQMGVDGAKHKIDTVTKVSRQQGAKLAELHKQVQPEMSLEVGMAYGYSTLYFLDAIASGGYGEKHIAIDPFQSKGRWAGIGVKAAELVGLSDKLEFIEERSDAALPLLRTRGMRIQFSYIDGSHWFEDALADFALSDRILDKGGVIIFDDMWMPALQKVVSFIERNRGDAYQRMEINFDNLASFRKISDGDQRDWAHYTEF